MPPIQSVPVVEAETLAFFDAERSVFGLAGPQVSVMFSADGTLGYSVSDSQQLTTLSPTHWSAQMTSMAGSFELDWRSHGAGAALDANDMMICDVMGKIAENGKRERRFRSHGVAALPSRKQGPPVLRSIAAVFDSGEAFFMNSYKPAVYHGHGDERNDAVLIEGGESYKIDDARLTTVYSKDDLHKQASVELWLSNDEFPRRLTGEAIEGTHVELTDRDVALAFYRWSLGPRSGIGYYEIALAAPPRRAA
ncbi:MAG: hypothetical protein WAP35_02685 [Solirubrobacterales bacterium]